MAKLNGVTTVDMVNGEITKVSYNCTEYVSVKGNAEHGDLGLRIDNDCYYAKVGEFYPIIKDNGGQLCIKDDVGHEPYIKRQNFELFRKQSSQVAPNIEDVNDKVDELAERVTALEQAEVEPEPAPLKVGDYAKVVKQSLIFNTTYPKGVFVKVTHVDRSEVPYEAGDLNGKNTRWFRPEHLTKATDEEVASAKAQAEADAIERKKTAVFTDAGRKPNEYRKGDIVKVIRRTTGHAVGTIGEIVKTEIHHYPMVKAKGDDGEVISLFSYVEPLVFVENRLDRN